MLKLLKNRLLLQKNSLRGYIKILKEDGEMLLVSLLKLHRELMEQKFQKGLEAVLPEAE
jgi:hypothetical protein